MGRHGEYEMRRGFLEAEYPMIHKKHRSKTILKYVALILLIILIILLIVRTIKSIYDSFLGNQDLIDNDKPLYNLNEPMFALNTTIRPNSSELHSVRYLTMAKDSVLEQFNDLVNKSFIRNDMDSNIMSTTQVNYVMHNTSEMAYNTDVMNITEMNNVIYNKDVMNTTTTTDVMNGISRIDEAIKELDLINLTVNSTISNPNTLVSSNCDDIKDLKTRLNCIEARGDVIVFDRFHYNSYSEYLKEFNNSNNSNITAENSNPINENQLFDLDSDSIDVLLNVMKDKNAKIFMLDENKAIELNKNTTKLNENKLELFKTEGMTENQINGMISINENLSNSAMSNNTMNSTVINSTMSSNTMNSTFSNIAMNNPVKNSTVSSIVNSTTAKNKIMNIKTSTKAINSTAINTKPNF